MDIKQILIDQKKELDYIISSKKIIKREIQDSLENVISSNLIKVISGIRRSGKSILCGLLLKNKKFAYANFDEKILLKIDPRDLLRVFHEIYGNFNYILLDEVQNHESWELMANTFHRSGYNLFITGSNARLLSRELSSHLTGRHIDIELFPFSFREYLTAIGLSFEYPLSSKEMGEIKHNLLNYMSIGGFPEIVVNKENPRIYLRKLFDDIIEKDIVLRYRIRYIETFREIVYSVLANFSNPISLNKLKKQFNLGSEHTIKNYLRYLEEAFIILQLKKFSFKPREIELSERKIYCIDTGFIKNVAYTSSDNIGRLMENIVYIDLLRRRSYFNPNMEIYYYKDYQGHEIDFLIKEGPKVKELVQVTYAIEFDEINPREYRSLIKVSELFKQAKLTVITWDYENQKRLSWFGREALINFVPLWKWLLKI